MSSGYAEILFEGRRYSGRICAQQSVGKYGDERGGGGGGENFI
jgi:hypothetical protein